MSIIGSIVKFKRDGVLGEGIALNDIDSDQEIDVKVTAAFSHYEVGSTTYVNNYELISINPPGGSPPVPQKPGFTVVIQSQPIRFFDSEQFALLFGEGMRAAFKFLGTSDKVYIDRIVNERTEVE